MGKLVVEEMSGSEAFSLLAPEWQALFNATNASPFLSWEWISAWHKWLGREKRPRLFCAREDGLLVGLLALGEEERSRRPAPSSYLVSRRPTRRFGLSGRAGAARLRTGLRQSSGTSRNTSNSTSWNSTGCRWIRPARRGWPVASAAMQFQIPARTTICLPASEAG